MPLQQASVQWTGPPNVRNDVGWPSSVSSPMLEAGSTPSSCVLFAALPHHRSRRRLRQCYVPSVASFPPHPPASRVCFSFLSVVSSVVLLLFLILLTHFARRFALFLFRLLGARRLQKEILPYSLLTMKCEPLGEPSWPASGNHPNLFCTW